MTSGRRARAMRQGQVLSAGIAVEAKHRFNAPLTDPGPGEHLWTMLGMWRIADPGAIASSQVHLDLENLLSIEGPGCFKCETPWTAELEAQPCAGTMELAP